MAGLFLVDQSGKLTALTQSDYASEDLLQGLLADYPDLLGGDEMGAGEPRQWLFVAREAPVPDREGGAGRWSLDHLFLDQDSVPTFVEVKRASDSRIRREVVGQMLDYAANGLRYWPVEAIQGFLARDGVSADDRLAATFGADIDTGLYWQRLKENIAEGRVRLLFVADRIPDELLAVVEFLNRQMDHTEVLAVEIPQFTGEGLRTLAPRVLGQTQEAVQRKGATRTTGTWDEERFFAKLVERNTAEDVAVVRRYFDWMASLGWRILYGRGKENGSFWGRWPAAKEFNFPIVCYSNGGLEVELYWMASWPPFDDIEKRREFVRRLNMIPGLGIPDDEVTLTSKRPSIPFSALRTDGAFQALTDAIIWYKAEAEEA